MSGIGPFAADASRETARSPDLARGTTDADRADRAARASPRRSFEPFPSDYGRFEIRKSLFEIRERDVLAPFSE